MISTTRKSQLFILPREVKQHPGRRFASIPTNQGFVFIEFHLKNTQDVDLAYKSVLESRVLSQGTILHHSTYPVSVDFALGQPAFIFGNPVPQECRRLRER